MLLLLGQARPSSAEPRADNPEKASYFKEVFGGRNPQL
jgi:hypothetical protein